jgi:hypothetical protein
LVPFGKTGAVSMSAPIDRQPNLSELQWTIDEESLPCLNGNRGGLEYRPTEFGANAMSAGNLLQ